MRDRPTAREKDFYRENGFLSVPEFLDRTELAAWRDIVEAAVRSRGKRRFSFAADDAGDIQARDSGDREYYDRVFTQRVNLWQANDALKALLLEPGLGRFGYRLSYTTFNYSGLRLHPGPHGSETATVTITNTGRTAGAEVAQLYLTDPASAGQPPYQLKGFQKITFTPGRSQQVTFAISNQDMSYYNTATSRWAAAPGTYQVSIGSNERDLTVSDSYQASGTGGNH